VGEEKEYIDLVVTPKLAGLSEGWMTVGIKTVFFSGNTLKKRLRRVKPKGKGKKKNIFYIVSCDCGVESKLEKLRKTIIYHSQRAPKKLVKNGWRERRRGGGEAATSSLLASHAVEHNHKVNWKEVTILAKKTNPSSSRRKIHGTAVMHIEENVISQPSIDIDISSLRKEKREVIRERKPREEVITRTTKRT
jgi:hypothetical protein